MAWARTTTTRRRTPSDSSLLVDIQRGEGNAMGIKYFLDGEGRECAPSLYNTRTTKPAEALSAGKVVVLMTT